MMMTSPCRRIGVIAGCCLSSLLIPLGRISEKITDQRLLRSLAGGLLMPMLLTTALSVLTPEIGLYGLAVYALNATFTPGLAAILSAFWTDVVHDVPTELGQQHFRSVAKLASSNKVRGLEN